MSTVRAQLCMHGSCNAQRAGIRHAARGRDWRTTASMHACKPLLQTLFEFICSCSRALAVQTGFQFEHADGVAAEALELNVIICT